MLVYCTVDQARPLSPVKIAFLHGENHDSAWEKLVNRPHCGVILPKTRSFGVFLVLPRTIPYEFGNASIQSCYLEVLLKIALQSCNSPS